MAQTLVPIDLIKDRQVATAIDAVAQIVSNAGFVAGGSQTSEIVGTAADKITTSTPAANVVAMVASGTDTNVSILIDGAGTGVVALGGLTGTAIADAAVQIVPTASAVDFVQITGSATDTPGAVTIAAAGTDSNIDLLLNSKGTGTLKLASGSFIANAAVATAMSSVGPTGSHTTVQKWLQIKDNSGTVLFIPCF